MGRIEKTESGEVPYKQTEVDKVKKATLVALLSLENNLDGIDTNPVVALRDALLFSGDAKILSHHLGFYLDDPSAEDVQGKCLTAKKFLVNGVLETIRDVSSRASKKEELSSDEQRILVNLMLIKTPSEEKYDPKTLKIALEKHFAIPSRSAKTNGLDPDDVEAIKSKKQTSKEARARNPEIIQGVLMARVFEKKSIWKIAEQFDLSYLATSEILEKHMLDADNQAIPKPPPEY